MDVKDLTKKYEYAWEKYSDEDLKKVFDLSDRYKNFMTIAKTERECVDEFVVLAEKQGYRDLNKIIENNESLKAGDKVYVNHMGKSLALFLLGESM